jgi:hypothetical protein
MKLLILIAFISMAVPAPQSSRPKSKRVVKKINSADTHPAAEANKKQENSENQTIQTILSVVTQIQQIQTQVQNATAKQQAQENDIQGKLVAYTGWLVAAGFIQAIALFLTAWTIKRQVALTQPRLHVDGIRVDWLKENHEPVFFVKIMNSGVIAAEKVAIQVKVELAGSVIRYARDQVITIPANGIRECPFPSRTPINAVLLAEFENGSALLRVSGHITWDKQETEYCYKYYPWPSKLPRPGGLPSFVPCDFDTNITADVTAAVKGTAAVIATLGTTPPTPK